jgi:hypothetical protein
MFNGLGTNSPTNANRFTGSHTIGKAVFIDNLALFCIFCFLVGLRFILDPKAFMRSLQDRFLGSLRLVI